MIVISSVYWMKYQIYSLSPSVDTLSGQILGLHPANERSRLKVMLSLIG